MRDIKFRGKALYTDEKFHKYDWVYGGIYDGSDFNKVFIVNYLEGLVEVDSKTVGQFTGLYDKEGNEIWEGDVVEIYTDNRIKNEPKLIEWWNGQFVFKAFNISQSIYEDRDYINFGWWAKDGTTINQIKVIGNIHDNSELL